MDCCFILERRVVIELSGADRYSFLQGLITNDVSSLEEQQSDKRVMYSLMLTPQGKVLYDFFIYPAAEKLLLDCPLACIEEIKKRLTLYKLRADVCISSSSEDLKVVLSFQQLNDSFIADPRCQALGYRVLLSTSSFTYGEKSSSLIAEYEKKRILLGIPDATQDFLPQQFFPLELGLDKLHAIDYQKGCYIGQEVTARTTYRGVVRKHIYPISLEKASEPGEPIMAGEEKIGVRLGSYGSFALALLNQEKLKEENKFQQLTCAGAPVQIFERLNPAPII